MVVKKKNTDVIEGNAVEYSTHGKVLGLTMGRIGICKLVEHIVNKGLHALTELQIFKKLPIKIKTHLIKAYILPIIRYPPIPLVNMTRHNKDKLQTIQNKALRFALEERYPYQRITETLHRITKVEPINYYLY